jgi:peroxiredoxin
MGYLLDEAGCIASHLTIGAQPILELANEAGIATLQVPETRGKRDLSTSGIARNGLTPGTHAPDFRLPCVDGQEIALEELIGKSVLLIFSDPTCSPCSELMPHLERIHQERPDIQVLMISRGTADENALKISEHNLSFPVLLQRKWEISRLYAFFGAPAGYLIDENGIIITELATGVDSILALVPKAS